MRWLFRIALTVTLLFITNARIGWMQEAAPPPLDVRTDLPAQIALQYYDDLPTTWLTMAGGSLVQVAPDFLMETESFGFAWSPDCTRYAFSAISPADEDEQPFYRIWAGDYGSDEVTPVSPIGIDGSASQIFWSPESTRIGYHVFNSSGIGVNIATLETGENFSIALELAEPRIAGWIDEARLIVYNTQMVAPNVYTRDYYLVTLAVGDYEMAPLPGQYDLVLPDSAHGDRFAALTYFADENHFGLMLYALDGTLLQELAPAVWSVGLYWSFDGTMLAYQDVDGVPHVVDIETGEDRALALNPYSDYVMGWSRDGSHLIYRYPLAEFPSNNGLAIYEIATDTSKLLLSPDPTDSGLYSWSACIP